MEACTRMEITSKGVLWQCRQCSAHYPSEFVNVLALHLQWHIEQAPDQQHGQHTCHLSGRSKIPCNAVFSTPADLAHHILDNHTRKRWCSTEKEKFKRAREHTEEEKYQMIQMLSTKSHTPTRLFQPKHN